MDSIFHEIRLERSRQDQKWGEQNHDPADWCTILGEEIGEVNKAAFEAKNLYKPWIEYRKELVQSAAVIIAMIECFDRHYSVKNEALNKLCKARTFIDMHQRKLHT